MSEHMNYYLAGFTPGILFFVQNDLLFRLLIQMGYAWYAMVITGVASLV